MELVLTEARTGGYRAHRPTCKKIGDDHFDPEELNRVQVVEAKPCSSCKPKPEDMDAMVNSVSSNPGNPGPAGEAVSLGDDDEDGFLDDEDLLGEDLLGDVEEPEAEVKPKRKAPKAKPAEKPAKTPELKAEEVADLLNKVFDHLSLPFPEDMVFPGFGKAIKTEAKQTVYLNSKGTADVRANSREQADEWVEAGLAERRGGNYVRVAVRDL